VKLETHIPLHKVIAEQFIDNPDECLHATHINADKTDNRIENLAWVVKSIQKKRVRQNVFTGELPEGYIAFTEYTVRPERTDSSGEIIPADVRQFDNVFIKWEEEKPSFIIYDATAERCQYVKHDKQNPNCVKFYDHNHKLTSVTFTKCSREGITPQNTPQSTPQAGIDETKKPLI
jgi:hypothetical protein